MAEQEVIKHTKKVYEVWNDKDHPWWHKFKEFLLEIAIIVFAVTISIWFHDLSERRHKQHDVKEFLLGLKTDLKHDIGELESDKRSFEGTLRAFTFVNKLRFQQQFDADSLYHFAPWFFNETGFMPNNGRFEGFKASGKIGDIENKELQNDIMDLYQEDVSMLVASTDFFSERKGKLIDYLTKNLKQESATTSNLGDVMASDEARNICRNLFFIEEIISHYDSCIAKSNKIIEAVDKEYGE